MSGRGDGTDEDALWQSIVANYGERASLDDEPEAEDPGATGTADGPDPHDPGRERGTSTGDAAPSPQPRVSPDPAPVDPWVERHLAEEHFVPPEPPPTPLPEPRRLLAWVGVLGVPALLVLLVVLHVTLPSWASLLMLVWFLGGFGYLVATMRRDDDDDWDDGAVV